MKSKNCSVEIIRSRGVVIFSIISVLISSSAIGWIQWTKSATNTVIVKQQPCTDCLTDIYHAANQTEGRHLSNRPPCCRPTEKEVKELSGKVDFLQKRQREQRKHSRILISHTPASVHKYLLSSDQVMNFSNVDHVTVELDTKLSERNSNNHVRGVSVKNDGIEILHTGLYYVYSSIFYKPNTDISSEYFPYQTWFHYVYRTRPNSPAMSSVILRTVFTCCPNCANSKDSVYTGGVFHLLAGDLIQVCLSGQGLMGRDTIKDSSFLGLFMLNSN